MKWMRANSWVWVVCLLAIAGCFGKPESAGPMTALYVVADADIRDALEGPLRDTFERVIITPQVEKVFKLIWVAPDKFNEVATKRNLALVGTLDADGEISQKVAAMLAPQVRSRVEEGSAFVFPKEDPWARNQILLVLAGTSVEELAKKLTQNKDYLYALLEKRLLDETAVQMYEQFEQKELSEEILSKYGWTLRVQHDYFPNIEREDSQFYMLRRSLPGRERWLFVHWIEDADPAVLDSAWVLNTRDKIGMKFYKSDKINRDPRYLKIAEVTFANRRAIMMEGLWENDLEAAGGPFRNYTFYDEASGRIYMIDIAVFFPGGRKEPFLRQLDVMAHTFQTADEVKRLKAGEGS